MKNIAHTIQKPSGLILYGNGNEKKKRVLTLCALSCPCPIQDGIEASLVGLLQDAYEKPLCSDLVSQKYSL